MTKELDAIRKFKWPMLAIGVILSAFVGITAWFLDRSGRDRIGWSTESALCIRNHFSSQGFSVTILPYMPKDLDQFDGLGQVTSTADALGYKPGLYVTVRQNTYYLENDPIVGPHLLIPVARRGSSDEVVWLAVSMSDGATTSEHD